MLLFDNLKVFLAVFLCFTSCYAVYMPGIYLENLSGEAFYYKIVFRSKPAESQKLAYGAEKKIDDVDTADVQISGTSLFSRYTSINNIMDAIKKDMMAVSEKNLHDVMTQCRVKITVDYSKDYWNVHYKWMAKKSEYVNFCKDVKINS